MNPPTSASREKLFIEKWPSPKPPSPPEGKPPLIKHQIRFRHPGYSDDRLQNVLLTMYAFDHPDGGLHYGTAFLACAIIAGNIFDGYLTDTRDGRKLNLEWDELLVKKNYYFHAYPPLDDAAERQPRPEAYPVCLTFANWSFPHENMPANWPNPPPSSSPSADPNNPRPPASGLVNYVQTRDKGCLITSSIEHIDTAHIVPREEVDWFKQNSMNDFNNNKTLQKNYVVDDIANAFALRPDLHSAFDQRKFMVAYKKSGWTIHFLRDTVQLGSLYHNTAIDFHEDVSACLLLARFAWSIFPMLEDYLTKGYSRRVRIIVKDGETSHEETKLLDSDQLQQIFNPQKSRQGSPVKRARSGSVDAVDAWEDTDNSYKRPRYASYELRNPSRGRKRFRSASPERAQTGISHSRSSSVTRVASHEWEADLPDLRKGQLKWLKAQRPQDTQECLGVLEELHKLPDGWRNHSEGQVA